MHRPSRQWGCWPLEAQELLLRASLLDGPDARDAWSTWQRGRNIDTIDVGSRRLLPLVYRNLAGQVAGSPALDRAQAIYKRTWYKNNAIIGRLVGLLRACDTAGITTMVLKGVPLALRYYKDVALRPMSDVDLLVPGSRAADALDVVRAAGFDAKDDGRQWPPRFTASRGFRDHAGLELDLHCHVLHECLHDGDDNAFWTGAQALDAGGVAALALNPADQLLHVVVHGLRHSLVPPVRWVADAATIIRASAAGLEWERLVEQARQRRLGQIVATGLRYLQNGFDVGVPPAVMRALDDVPASLTERAELWARSRAGHFRLGVEVWCEYTRSVGRERRWRGALGFPRYVQDRWGASRKRGA